MAKMASLAEVLKGFPSDCVWSLVDGVVSVYTPSGKFLGLVVWKEQ